MCTLDSLLYLFLIWRRVLFGNSVAIRVKSEPKVASACGVHHISHCWDHCDDRLSLMRTTHNIYCRRSSERSAMPRTLKKFSVSSACQRSLGVRLTA